MASSVEGAFEAQAPATFSTAFFTTILCTSRDSTPLSHRGFMKFFTNSHRAHLNRSIGALLSSTALRCGGPVFDSEISNCVATSELTKLKDS
uniref:Uncharacterized protein n=1 Tax=Setaria italica TaxID=4555 RepID=K4AH80_SETIT